MGIKDRFCIKCGKKTSKLLEGLCIECYLKEQEISLPKKVYVELCKKCGAIRQKGIWINSKYPPEYFLTLLLTSKIKIPKEAELDNVEIEELGKNGTAKVTFSILGKKYTKNYKIDSKIQKTVCRDCSRIAGLGYKAIIQARSERNAKAFSKAVINFSNKYRANIVKIEEQKRGVDLYLHNLTAAKHLASELRKEFKARMSETSESYGWDRMKDRPQKRVIILLKTKCRENPK